MTELKGKLTYANVIGTIALFVALGGGAYAATQLQKNSVGARQLKAGAVITPKIKKGAVTKAKIAKSALNALRGPTGPIGPSGYSGPTGATGATGSTGATGADAAGAYFARIDSLGAASFTPMYGSVTGATTSATPNEGNVTMLSPAVPIIVRDLHVEVTPNAPAMDCPDAPACARTFGLSDDGLLTTVTCTIFDQDTTCDSGDSTATISPDSKISIFEEIILGQVNNNTDALITWRAVTP